MAMNNMGAGFVLTARDMASPVFRSVGRGFNRMVRNVRSRSRGMMNALAPLAVGFGLKKLSSGLMGASVGIADAAENFEYGLSAVGAVSNATTEQMKMLHDEAIRVASVTEWSPDQAVEGLKNLATAGFTATEQTKMLAGVMDLATGSMGQMGLAEAADAVGGTIRAYALKAGDAAEVTDKLLRITQMTNFQARDFSVGLARAASTGKLFGQTLDDVLIQMGLLRNMNIDASVASTSLRESWRRLAADQRAQNIVRSKGVELLKEDGKEMRDFMDIMIDLSKATQNLGEVERNRVAVQAFGVRGMAAFNAVADAAVTRMIDGVEVTVQGAEAVELLRMEMSDLSTQQKREEAATNASTDALKAYTKTAQGSAGAAKIFKDRLLETYSGQKKLISGVTETIKTLFGEAAIDLFKPIAKTLYEVLLSIMNFVKNLPMGTRKAIVMVVGLGGVLAGLIGTLLMLAAVMSFVGFGLLSLVGVVAGLVLLGGPLVALFSGMSVGVVAVWKAFKKATGAGADLSTTLSKIGLLVRGAVDIISQGHLGEELQKEFALAENKGLMPFLVKIELWLQKIKAFWGGLKEGFGAAVDSLIPRLQELKTELGFVFDLFGDKGPGDTMEDWATKGRDAGLALGDFGHMAIDMFKSVAGTLSKVAKFIDTITADDVLQGIRDLVGLVKGTVETLQTLGTVLGYIGSFFGALWQAIKTIITTIVEIIMFVPTLAATEINKTIGYITGNDQKVAQAMETQKNLFTGEFFTFGFEETSGPRGVQGLPKKTGVTTAGGGGGSGVFASPIEQLQLENLRERKKAIKLWMNQTKEQYAAAGGTGLAWSEAGDKMQKQYVDELGMINDRIAELIKSEHRILDRPIVLMADGKQLAKTVGAGNEAIAETSLGGEVQIVLD